MSESYVISKNMSDIYRIIYQNKQCSRQEIAEQINLSLPTVTHCLNQLQEFGYIYKAGEFESTGGRKPTILQCVPNIRYSMGIDITKNHLSIVLIDLNLNIIKSKRMRYPFKESEEYFLHLQSEIDDIIENYVPDYSRLLGIGIALPAIMEENQKTISYATVINASRNIYDTFAHYICEPFLFFNDSNSSGLAESWKARYTEPVVYLSLNSSVGGANLNNQDIYTGVNWRGCEFGHMTIVPHGRKCYCGCYGCLDAYCSASLLSDFTGGDLNLFFTELKHGENKGLQHAFDEYLDYLAIGVNNLRMCYDCDVILGGNVGAHMSDYIDTFRQKAIQLNPFEKDGSYIRVCHYRTEAAAVGAAIYYVNEFIQNL